MKEIAVRLKKNADLKKSIEDLCKDLKCCVILSSVGSLSKINIRLASAKTYLNKEAEYEILSLNGTIADGIPHLHLAVSDENGNCFGGHLEYGCLINTTCELVIVELEHYDAERVFDEETGYKEIIFKE